MIAPPSNLDLTYLHEDMGIEGFPTPMPPYWPAKERDGVILSVVVGENEVTSLSPLSFVV
jgi:hypothetical protein